MVWHWGGGVTLSGGGKYRINWTSGPKPFQWGYFSSLTNVSMGLGWNLCTVVKGPWDKYVYKKYKTSQKISKEIHHKTFVCPSEGCDKLFKGILPPPPQFSRKKLSFLKIINLQKRKILAPINPGKIIGTSSPWTVSERKDTLQNV